MRRVLLLLLVVSVFLAGCTLPQTVHVKERIDFYYLQPDFNSKEDSGIFSKQQHDVTEFSNTEDLLSSYLQGPDDADCKSPFPENTDLVSYKNQNDVAYLTLSNSFKELSGYDLTLACVCIAKTVFSAKDVLAVQIRVKDGAIRGDELYITLREKDLVFFDSGTLTNS